MLIDLANVLGRRIAASIDLVERDQAVKAINAALDAARELLGASKAEVYLVGPSDTEGYRGNMFFRFACSPRKPNSLEPMYKRKSNYPMAQKGVWQYVYDKNAPIWVTSPNHNEKNVPDKEPSLHTQETNTDAAGQNAYCPPLENQIFDTPLLSAMYNFADKNSETVITIPFTKTIEEREACWGILDLEFRQSVAYSEDQFKALEMLTNNIASIAWKTKAWEQTKKDTERVIQQFVDWCEQLGNATMPYKTGLWINHDSSEQALYDDLVAWFGANGIQIDEYSLETKTAKFHMTLDIRQIIEKEHFGIVDLTRYDQKPDLLFLLGLFAMNSRPCLVLSSSDSRVDIPPIVESSSQHLIKRQAGQTGQAGDSLLHVYQYDVVDKDVVFFRNGAEVNKKETLNTFLQSVRTQSAAFRAAHDYLPGKDKPAQGE